MGIFSVADYDSEVRIGKFKIWCQNCKIWNGGSKMADILVQILSFLAIAPKLGISGVSGVADHDSGIRIAKLKMEDWKWRWCEWKSKMFWQLLRNLVLAPFVFFLFFSFFVFFLNRHFEFFNFNIIFSISGPKNIFFYDLIIDHKYGTLYVLMPKIRKKS